MPTTPYNFSTGEVITETRLDTHTTAITELQAADVLQVARLDALEAENSVSTADIANEAVTRVKLAPAVITEIEGKTDLGHAHVMTDVSDADWAATIHTHSTADLTDADYAATSHSHAIGDVSGVVPAAQGGAGTVTGILKADGLGTVSAASAGTDYLTPTGNGSGLTSLNGSNIASGTVADARLSSNVPLLNAANSFSYSGTASLTSSNDATYGGLFVRNTNAAQYGGFSVVNDASTALQFGVYGSSHAKAGNAFIMRATNGPIGFFTNGLERVTILGGGNVGIGTSIPAQKLDVLGTASSPTLTHGDTAIARFRNASPVELEIGGLNGTPYSMWIQARHAVDDAKDFPLALNPVGGEVGIGVSAPTYGLHVAPSVGVTAGQTAFFQDATASTGKTGVLVKEGAGNVAGDKVVQIQSNAGTALAYITGDGTIVSNVAASGIVLKDAAATPHYWRITVGTDGTLGTTDLGTTAP